MSSDRDRLGAALGAAGVLGNLVGVAALGGVEGAYKPSGLVAWSASALAHPGASVASAVAFTVGLLALAGWALALGRRLRGPAAALATGAMVGGATVNAAGTLAPAVLVLHVAPACAGAREACTPVARALLGLTLSLDALFNLWPWPACACGARGAGRCWAASASPRGWPPFPSPARWPGRARPPGLPWPGRSG